MPRSRAARLAVTFAFVAHGAIFGTWVARIPAVKGDLGLGEAQLGLALFAAALGTLLALPVAGITVARIGSRPGTAWGVPVFALILPFLALAPNLPALAVTLFLFGAAAAMLDVAMNAHSLAVEGTYGRPILSSFHAGWSFGGLLGAAAGALAAAAGVEPFWHFLAVAVVVGVPGAFLERLLLPAEVDRPEVPPSFVRPPRRLLALAVLGFCGLFAEGAAADWGAVYLNESVGSGAGVAALAFACFSVAMAVTRLAGDAATVRLGPVTVTRAGGVIGGTRPRRRRRARVRARNPRRVRAHGRGARDRRPDRVPGRRLGPGDPGRDRDRRDHDRRLRRLPRRAAAHRLRRRGDVSARGAPDRGRAAPLPRGPGAVDASGGSGGVSALDRVMPAWHFSERHAVDVDAPPERALAAAREVRLRDIPAAWALLVARGLATNVGDRTFVGLMHARRLRRRGGGARTASSCWSGSVGRGG